MIIGLGFLGLLVVLAVLTIPVFIWDYTRNTLTDRGFRYAVEILGWTFSVIVGLGIILVLLGYAVALLFHIKV